MERWNVCENIKSKPALLALPIYLFRLVSETALFLLFYALLLCSLCVACRRAARSDAGAFVVYYCCCHCCSGARCHSFPLIADVYAMRARLLFLPFKHISAPPRHTAICEYFIDKYVHIMCISIATTVGCETFSCSPARMRCGESPKMSSVNEKPKSEQSRPTNAGEKKPRTTAAARACVCFTPLSVPTSHHRHRRRLSTKLFSFLHTGVNAK